MPDEISDSDPDSMGRLFRNELTTFKTSINPTCPLTSAKISNHQNDMNAGSDVIRQQPGTDIRNSGAAINSDARYANFSSLGTNLN